MGKVNSSMMSWFYKYFDSFSILFDVVATILINMHRKYLYNIFCDYCVIKLFIFIIHMILSDFEHSVHLNTWKIVLIISDISFFQLVSTPLNRITNKKNTTSQKLIENYERFSCGWYFLAHKLACTKNLQHCKT